ncbi:unnamed protein product [Phaeothamnion confervicola]
MKKRRGMSLVEALLSLVLVGIAMGVVAQLAGLLNNVLRASGQKDAALEVELAMLHVASELRCACTWTSPPNSSYLQVNELVFSKVDPDKNPDPAASDSRLPLPVSNPLPLLYNGFDSSFMVTVRYYLASGTLMREVNGSAQPIASLVDFAASNRSDGLFQLNFSYMQGDTKITRTHPAFLPLR